MLQKKDCWERELDDQRVRQTVDKTATFKCMFSRPNAKIRWYKGKQEIFTGMKCKIISEKEICTLVINNPEEDDAAKYTCEANGIPTSAFLYVDEPPMNYEIEKPLPATQEVTRTKEGTIEFKVNSNRAPVVWYKNGVEISRTDGRYLIEKDAVGRCSLTFKKVEEGDEGLYEAKISGTNKATKVQVYVVEPRFEFVSPLKSQKCNERETVTFECDVNDRDAEVEWWHDGQKVKIDGVNFEEQKTNRRRRLIVKNVKTDYEGEYKCTTKDDSTIAQLIVEAANKFTEKLKDKSELERKDVKFTCTTKDNKTPAIWINTKTGKKITHQPGGKYQCVSRNGQHYLQVCKLELSESGDVFEIDVAGLKATAKLTVLEAEKKPILTGPKKPIEGEVDKPLILKIPYSIKGTRQGDPGIKLRKNGKEVHFPSLPSPPLPSLHSHSPHLTSLSFQINLKDPKAGVEVVVTPDGIEIKLKSPERADNGKWELDVINSAGSATAPFEMVIRDRPGAPKGPLDVANVSAEGCDLSWKPPDWDGGAPLVGYSPALSPLLSSPSRLASG